MYLIVYRAHIRIELKCEYEVYSLEQREFFLPSACKISPSGYMTFYRTAKRFSIEIKFHTQ